VPAAPGEPGRRGCGAGPLHSQIPGSSVLPALARNSPPHRLTPSRDASTMIGKLVLRVRQKYGHGFRVAYYRDVVRRRILKSPPVSGLTDDCCELHVLTSQQDWLNLVWALKSFYWSSGRRYALCIHDDGTLEANSQRELARHFPGARIITRDK